MNAIIVRYDFVSRPSFLKVGKKGGEIWDYPNSGFMETFTYDDIEDDKYDEEYIIVIPE